MPPLNEYWRPGETPETKAQSAKAEFPESVFGGMLTRREFLGAAGSLAALAALSACRKPAEAIVARDVQPEEAPPGESLYFATTLDFAGFGRGALVRSREGRPVKVEGNPLHPDSLGATDAFMQAAVLDLYDADRSQAVLEAGRPSSWSSCLRALRRALDAVRPRGAGLRILAGPDASPTLAAQRAELSRLLPEARWHVHDPAGGPAVPRMARYDLSKADVLVCVDDDLLSGRPGSLAYARAFADRRDPDAGRPPLRFYALETALSVTGANADHRLSAKPSRIGAVMAELCRRLGLRVEGPKVSGPEAAWVEAAARDLSRAGSAGVVAVGPRQPAEVQELGFALNARLRSAAAAYAAPLETGAADPARSFAELCRDMADGRVAALLILDRNPVYSAADASGFTQALARVPFTLHVGSHVDETAAACAWHVPLAHALESWSDARAFDGTGSIRQPLIAPLYGGLGRHALLELVLGRSASDHEAVRAHWAGRGLDDRAWDRALHDGVIPGTALAAAPAALPAGWKAPAVPAAGEGLELCLRPSSAVYDGAFANNAWLQERPDPLTTLTWGAAALISPAEASRRGLADGDVARLSAGGRKLEVPVWISPGQADDAVTLDLGYGRASGGRVASGVGARAYVLREADGRWSDALTLEKTGRRASLASTRGSQDMQGRDLVREASYETYKRDPGFARKPEDEPKDTLYAPEPPKSEEHAWAMAIDLSRCIGCSSCVVACQAENNVPSVGPDQVKRGRQMHWLRVDAYFKGEPEAPSGAAFQPVPCMHCEHAPCEPVCPTAATVHSPEGLNEMVYNRCVGTRYCSNNCPYKVRRFNFFRYSPADETSRLAANPDVTVRERGVMEKCTYCVQRIQGARFAAREEGRPMKDGDVVPACQAACPARAIVFGDLKDAESAVSRARRKKREYGLLSELGTRPRTTYLARVTNPGEEKRA